MADAATIAARLDLLRELRASGTKRARFADEEVEYKSDAEMRAAIADLENQLAAVQGRRAPPSASAPRKVSDHAQLCAAL